MASKDLFTRSGRKFGETFPGDPCDLCRKGTDSEQWCREMDTCAASVDWDVLAEDRSDQ